jgi:serine/threonine-protein kinase HipA
MNVSDRYCRISLQLLKGTEKHQGFRDADVKRLFGGELSTTALNVTRQDFFISGARASRKLSMSGVQPKLSAAVIDGQLQMVNENGRYIVKPSPEAFPYAAENEHAGMLFSRAMGVETASCALMSFQDGENVFVCRRFDREGDIRHPQEDILQLAGLPSASKYELSYEEAGNILSKGSNGKPAVVLEFFRRVVLAYIMGNSDLHLKNISLRRKTPDAPYHYYDLLTPNYDILFCDAIPELEGADFLALDLLKAHAFTEEFQHFGYYTRADFIELAKRLGLSERVVALQVDRFAKKLGSAMALVQHSFMPNEMKAKSLETVKGRMKVLL